MNPKKVIATGTNHITHREAWDLVRCGLRFEFGKIMAPPKEQEELLLRLGFIKHIVPATEETKEYCYFKPNNSLF